MQLGQTILNIRKENNLTQEKFAELFHVTRQTVSNWENEKSYPDLLTLVQISDTFDISLDKMLKEDLKMTKKLNKDIHYAKHIKNVLGAIIAVALVVSIVWYFVWSSCKDKVESKFQNGIEQYEYSIDENCSKGGYYIIDYSDEIYFALPNQTMPGYLDFSTDFHAKDLDCYLNVNGEDILILWQGYDKEGKSLVSALGKDEEDLYTVEKDMDDLLGDKELVDLLDYAEKLYKTVYE